MAKKAQAAMEFLMTYGWAILVVLIAIGALVYFGVTRPQNMLPESCIIGTGFGCDDFKVGADGSGEVIVRNGLGEQLTDVSVTLEGVAGTDCDAAATFADGTTLDCTWAAAALTAGTAGGKYKTDIVVTYTTAAGITHSKVGTLTTKYE